MPLLLLLLINFRDFPLFAHVTPETNPSDALSQDGDGEESMSSKPRPVWLETLLRKYASEVTNRPPEESAANAPPPPPTTNGLPPVGSLCAFLSCCAIRQVALTKVEEAALLEVPTPLTPTAL
mgnify:CR=1 FL=1